MPSVEVWNGDLEAALYHLKTTNEREGTLNDYKRHLSFSSPSEIDRHKRMMAQRHKKRKEHRREIRQREAIKRDGRDKYN